MKQPKLHCPVDGMIACEVGKWVKRKHEFLSRYIETCSQTRKKYLPNPKNPSEFRGGATYIDLFCGPGKSKIRDTNEWVDGSAVVAWKASQKNGAPFSTIYISDSNLDYLQACKDRLTALGANVVALNLGAIESVEQIYQIIDKKYGLHFAFIDPFDIKSLNFKIIESLAACKRIDMLIHLSKMDLQRNLIRNLEKEGSVDTDFDAFIPGWRTQLDLNQGVKNIRGQVVKLWTGKLEALGVKASREVDWKLIVGSRNQPLYWLMLVAKHELAHSLWGKASDTEGQASLFTA